MHLQQKGKENSLRQEGRLTKTMGARERKKRIIVVLSTIIRIRVAAGACKVHLIFFCFPSQPDVPIIALTLQLSSRGYCNTMTLLGSPKVPLHNIKVKVKVNKSNKY